MPGIRLKGEAMSDTNIKPEIKCAAAWWANKLREEPLHDNGDHFQSELITSAARRRPRPSEEQIRRFEAKLAELIALQPGFGDDMWDTKDPIRAGAYRGLHVDYHPTKEMEIAAEDAGIRGIEFLLPIKTNMFIDPGSVRVGCGYKTPLVEIYAKGRREMRFQDLVFREIEGAPPPQLACNGCGAQPVTLAAEISLPGQDGAKVLITLCSRACESVLRRHPDVDQCLAELTVKIGIAIERARGGDVQWPEEIDT